MIDLYFIKESSTCRAVLMTAKMLDLPLNIVQVDLKSGKQFHPEFLELNPCHTVPVIKDGDFILTESRAIMSYFVEKYGQKGNSRNLYPRDVRERATVNQRLYFDACVLHPSFSDVYNPKTYDGSPPSGDKLTKIARAFELLEIHLRSSSFVAGNETTIADISLVAKVVTFQACGYDTSSFPSISSWINRLKTVLPDYEEIIVRGAKSFAEFLKERIQIPRA